MKALYYPYTSPRSRETILRGLLLYEKLGAIQPKHIFPSEGPYPEAYATQLELLHDECEKYSQHNPLFLLDPKDLIKGPGQEWFTNAVISDMRNMAFKASVPQGTMTIYADKITRPLFEEFRKKIRPVVGMRPHGFRYYEGPYFGSPHFIWSVDEPLAHSILLNLTLLGLNRTGSVPVTDSPESQHAFLTKVGPPGTKENIRLAAERLVTLQFPSSKKLNVRGILDFRDEHKNDLVQFWKWLTEEQLLLGDAFDEGTQLSAVAAAKYGDLKNRIESAKNDLKWNIPGIAFDLILGFSGFPIGATALAVGHITLSGMKYATKRYRNTAGIGYLLMVAKSVGVNRRGSKKKLDLSSFN